MAPPYTTNLVVSLDASLTSYKDVGKTQACTVAGDQVYVWPDQSGLVNDVIQATAGNRPTYQPAIQNGLPVIRFAGTPNQYLQNAAVAGTFSTQAQTAFIVKQDRARNQQNTYIGQNANGIYHNTGFYDAYDGSAIHNTTNGTVGPFREFEVIVCIFDTTTIGWRQNGVNTTATSQMALNAPTNLSIGSLFSPAFYLNGDLCEVLIYNAALSVPNIQAVEAYLLAKWSIPLTYPTNQTLVVFEGDSLTEGTNSTANTFEYPEVAYQSFKTAHPFLGINYFNRAVPGSVFTNLVARASQVDALYSSSRRENILYVWCGTNDMNLSGLTPAQTLTAMQNYCLARKAVGWKVIVRTCLPRIAFNDTTRQTFNTLVRNNWQNFADGLDDLGNDPTIGQAGQYTNATYYTQVDGVHLTNAGYAVAATYVLPNLMGVGITSAEFVAAGFNARLARLLSSGNYTAAQLVQDGVNGILATKMMTPNSTSVSELRSLGLSDTQAKFFLNAKLTPGN